MEDIIKLLPNLLRLAQNNEDVCERAAIAAWRAAVGDAIARISRPQRLTRKMLMVAVADETWRRQLEQMASQILFKLNSLLGGALVTGLEFYIDAEAARAGSMINNARPLPEKFAPDPQLLAAAEQIKDAELRARFLTAAAKYLYAQEAEEEE